MLKQGKENICRGTEGMKYERYEEIRGRLCERLLGTILEGCIQEREAVLGPIKHDRRPSYALRSSRAFR
jgi:hypothetical protein